MWNEVYSEKRLGGGVLIKRVVVGGFRKGWREERFRKVCTEEENRKMGGEGRFQQRWGGGGLRKCIEEGGLG